MASTAPPAERALARMEAVGNSAPVAREAADEARCWDCLPRRCSGPIADAQAAC